MKYKSIKSTVFVTILGISASSIASATYTDQSKHYNGRGFLDHFF